MICKKNLELFVAVFAVALLAVAASAQAGRAKAELKVGSASITVDYGRPSTKGPTIQGREPLSVQQVGSFWRMGVDQSTTFTTPVDLMFGGTKIAKGSYSLWLLKESADSYKLALNSQTGQWGTEHDKTRDVAQIAMKKSTAPSPAELFTIELKEAPNGGTFMLTWGTAQLSADFQVAS